MREQLIKEVEIIPLEIVVRNVAAGSLAKRLGIEEGVVLPRSIIEFYYKADALDDPMVSEEHITAFGWASRRNSMTSWRSPSASTTSCPVLFLGVGIQLVDFKIECGRLFEGEMMRIVLADEISPDSCRCGMSRPRKRWTRTVSVATWAASLRLTRKWPAASAS